MQNSSSKARQPVSAETQRKSGAPRSSRRHETSPQGRVDLWQTAAAAGGAWGAVEITFGVFLHSLGVPATGFILAWFEAAFLTAVWTVVRHRGVVAVAAVTAGAMRFLVPTGSLFAPAVAISAQGLCVTLGLLVPGPLGAALGGGLALLWTVLQAVVDSLIYYGFDLVRLYAVAASGLARLVGTSGVMSGVWLAVGAVFGLGAAAGLVGMFVGRRAGKLGGLADSRDFVGRKGLGGRTRHRELASPDAEWVHEAAPPAWLLLGALGSVAVLWTGSLMWHVLVLGVLFGVTWAWNAAVLRRLGSPRFWGITSSVAAAAGLVAVGWHWGDVSWRWWAGLRAAALMVCRVGLLTLGSTLAQRWFRARGVGARLVRLGRFGRGLAHAWRMVPEATARLQSLRQQGDGGLWNAAAGYVAWAVAVPEMGEEQP